LDFIRSFIVILAGVNENYFISDDTLSLRMNEDYDEKIYNLLSLYDTYVENDYELFRFINIHYKNMSAGELELVNGFANLYTAIQIVILNSQINTILLLLDEPDASFHPEWSRRYINNIYQLLNNNHFEREIKFQIIITTHSPFIVSDVPRDYITCINVVEVAPGITERKVKKANFGLMSNFYDIIKDDFFITSPIGEYAKFIFKEIIEKIDRLKEYDINEIEILNEIIFSIGDEMIRIKLQQLLNEKKIELLSEEERIKTRIEELEMELFKLKNKQEGKTND
ncbi:AAA family ATPase, partial [Neobacillus drentensis]|uniref:AAA family ATPase n=1 Tax=Neobacillus drentensis TaxID=220684 RepID=UPI0030033700